MRFRFFGRKNEAEPFCPQRSAEEAELARLRQKTDSLLAEDDYIPCSRVTGLQKEAESLTSYFHVLEKTGMLPEYCRKNHLPPQTTQQLLQDLRNLQALADDKNEAFICSRLQTEERYLDHILDPCGAGLLLDEDQRRVVLSDEDHLLVVAGAGTGKTTTVAAKVRYLTQKKNVDPHTILVVSFTNKAVGELRERINRQLGIDCPIATFHAVGYALLRRQSGEKLNVVDQGRLYYVLQQYFRRDILHNEAMLHKVLLFFAGYFDAPLNESSPEAYLRSLAKAHYASLRGEMAGYSENVTEARSKRNVTLQSEPMRSRQETLVANFLYLNSIDYEYEPLYRYDLEGAKKPYTPDFLLKQDGKEVYLEHFGLTESGENKLFTPQELTAYKKAVNDKILLHRQHGTKLIYTFSAYDDRRSITQHLAELLVKAGFRLQPRDSRQVMAQLLGTEENRYVHQLVLLMCRFIANFKTQGFSDADFGKLRSWS